MRQTHDVKPNTPAWLALRETFDGTASEAPIMMDESSHTTRDAWIKEKATGIKPEIDPYTQRRFDKGHEYERVARPLMEKLVGEALYPTTVSDIIDGLHLGASLDGETLDGKIIAEHKGLNQKLAASVPNNDLDLEYRIQMEQQLMLSGADKCLFVASKDGDEETMVRMWYYPDLDLQKRIIAGWKQALIDIKNYQPEAEVIRPVANSVTDLPVVSVSVSGSIDITDNFKLFENALRDFIDNQLITDPETDQDFADLELQIKALKTAESALDASEKAIIAQIPTIEEKQRIKKMLSELTRSNRLASEKLLKQKKDAVKVDILNEANKAFSSHLIMLNESLGFDYMPDVQIDVAGKMRGRHKVTSLQSAANDVLAQGKIMANAIAEVIRVNIKALQNVGGDKYPFLFRDLRSIIIKESEDFLLLAQSRISTHKAEEEQKLEAQREQIRAEEQAKAAAEQREKAAQEQAAQEQAERDREVRELRDRIDREKAEEDRQAELEKIRLDAKAQADKRDAEQAEKDRIAVEEAVERGRASVATVKSIARSLAENGISETASRKVAALIVEGKIEGVRAR